MTARYDIIHGTVEWHEVRYGKISGTVSKGLFSDYKTLLNNLVACQLEEFDWEYDHDLDFKSQDMIRGLQLEPEAIQKLKEKFGIDFRTCGWIQSNDYELLGISPDAISDCETIHAEIKCVNRNKHTKAIRNDVVPHEYTHQIIHAFAVNPYLEKLIFAMYRPESRIQLFTKEITMDSELNIGTEGRKKMTIVGDHVENIYKKVEKIQRDIKAEVERISF